MIRAEGLRERCLEVWKEMLRKEAFIHVARMMVGEVGWK